MTILDDQTERVEYLEKMNEEFRQRILGLETKVKRLEEEKGHWERAVIQMRQLLKNKKVV